MPGIIGPSRAGRTLLPQRKGQKSALGKIVTAVLREAVLKPVPDTLKALAGATTGMHSVRTPGDLLGREANAALAATNFVPQTKGVAPAIAITTKATQLRRALGLGNAGRDVMAAREMAELADVPMIPLTKDIRGLLDNVLPQAKAGAIEPGGAYRVPAKSKFGAFVDDRTAILQDPETGTMFVAPGVLHADLIDYVAANYPKYARGPAGYLQHEVYGPTSFATSNVPARMMFTSGRADTENATIARAQLVQNLRRLGVVGDTKKAAAQRKAMLARKK